MDICDNCGEPTVVLKKANGGIFVCEDCFENLGRGPSGYTRKNKGNEIKWEEYEKRERILMKKEREYLDWSTQQERSI